LIEENKKRLQYLDGSIVTLALVLCIISYQYYIDDIVTKYILVIVFAAIGLYYTSKFFKSNDQESVTPALTSDSSAISAIIMLGETGDFIKQWTIGGKTAILIGKNTKNTEVDIDLNDSMYDALIQDEHAVMNFAMGSWYLEGLHTPSSISLKKANDKMRYRLTGNRPCKLEPNDIVYIANTRLLLK